MNKINYTLGANFGIELMSIAQEKLVMQYDGEGALDFLMKSLPGLTEGTALDIIKGDLVIHPVNNEVVVRYRESDDPHPRINFDDYVSRIISYYIRSSSLYTTSFSEFYDSFTKDVLNNWNTPIEFTYSVEDDISDYKVSRSMTCSQIYKILHSVDKSTRDNLLGLCYSSNDLFSIINLIKHLKVLELECSNIDKVLKFLMAKYDYKPSTDVTKYYKSARIIYDLVIKLDSDISITPSTYCQGELDKYLSTELSDNTGLIEPSDGTERFDALWISPEGEIYGMNGTVANMCHNKLADRINERMIKLSGVSLVDDNDSNVDLALAKSGWARVHGNRVLYEGYDYDPAVPMTKELRTAIYNYIQLHYGGIMVCGMNKSISAARFNMTEDLMIKKLFDYG